jgi:hypothetical protein
MESNFNGLNFGKHLEDKLFEKLVALGYIETIANEEKLKRQWGWQAASVDYLLEVCGMVIPIQCKWRRSRRRENKGINNFLGSIKYLTEKQEKVVLFGLWVSRVIPFDDNREVLYGKHIFVVSDFNSIDWLVEKAITIIEDKLRSSGLIHSSLFAQSS